MDTHPSALGHRHFQVPPPLEVLPWPGGGSAGRRTPHSSFWVWQWQVSLEFNFENLHSNTPFSHSLPCQGRPPSTSTGPRPPHPPSPQPQRRAPTHGGVPPWEPTPGSHSGFLLRGWDLPTTTFPCDGIVSYAHLHVPEDAQAIVMKLWWPPTNLFAPPPS